MQHQHGPVGVFVALLCTYMSGMAPSNAPFFFFFKSYFFSPSLKIKTPPQAGFAVQICPREDAGGWGGQE